MIVKPLVEFAILGLFENLRDRVRSGAICISQRVSVEVSEYHRTYHRGPPARPRGADDSDAERPL